jgi:hypothetical protein
MERTSDQRVLTCLNRLRPSLPPTASSILEEGCSQALDESTLQDKKKEFEIMAIDFEFLFNEDSSSN